MWMNVEKEYTSAAKDRLARTNREGIIASVRLVMLPGPTMTAWTSMSVVFTVAEFAD